MSKNKKLIALLGSTGSIGTQTLAVVKESSDLFEFVLLSANKNYKLLYQQAKLFQPNHVTINSSTGYQFLKKNLPKTKVHFGLDDLCGLISSIKVDLIVSAIVGSAGLMPTIAAINAKINIALANKESLVVAGELIMRLAKKNSVSIIPVDSEHSAIFQCLCGEKPETINRLILTASGGPFLHLNQGNFKHIKRDEALQHPNWKMGSKITIDSATLMNKGLEVIEARWLFNICSKNIDVIIHPESIVHSLVEFCDGSIKAQLGFPEMKTPISYALSFPDRLRLSHKKFDLSKIKALNFLKPDVKKFPHLELAYEALNLGGTAPCVVNAANEIAVEAFLGKKISFLDMFKIVEKSLEKSIFVKNPNIDDYLTVDVETRKIANKIIKTL